MKKFKFTLQFQFAILYSMTVITYAKLSVKSRERQLSEFQGEESADKDIASYLYPQPKAFSRVYGCCVYYSTELDDMVCHNLDDECITEFRSLMNKYYIWGASLVALGLIAMTILMIHAKLTRDKSLPKAKNIQAINPSPVQIPQTSIENSEEQ